MPGLFHSKANQSLSSWVSNFQFASWGLGAFFTLVFGVLAGMMPHLFGVLNWPEKIFTGMAITVLLSLAISFAGLMAGLAVRAFFPAKAAQLDVAELPPSSPASPPYDDTALSARVSELENIKRAIVADYQNMSGLEARFDQALDKLKEAIQVREAVVDTNFKMQADRIVRLEALASLSSDKVATQISSVYGSLAAIYHREVLAHLGIEIARGAEALSAPTREAKVYDADGWQKWEDAEHDWATLLHQWCSLAGAYVEGVGDKIAEIPPSHYLQTGEAKSSQFPDAEAYIAYKQFHARVKNWAGWKQEVERAVHQVAFNGGHPVALTEAGYLENADE